MATSSSPSGLLFSADPYCRRRQPSPQRYNNNNLESTNNKTPPPPECAAFIPWRKHQKTHSSASLNAAFGRRYSLESLSGGSLRNGAIGHRSLRWKLQPQLPMIQKLSSVAHFHYDIVELGPIKVEVLPLLHEDGIDLLRSTDRSYHSPYHHHHHSFANILPVLREHCSAVSAAHHEPYPLSPDSNNGSPSQTAAAITRGGPLKQSDSRVGASNSNSSNIFKHHQDCGPPTAGYLTEAGGVETGAGAPSMKKKITYALRVHSNQQTWTIQRTYEDFVEFDKQLHRCVYDRRFSLLKELPAAATTATTTPSSSSPPTPFTSTTMTVAVGANNINEQSCLSDEATCAMLSGYMERFSDLAGSLITCFPVLKWLELDNRGNHLVTAEDTQINIPALAAAYVVQNYVAGAVDELTLKVGDIVSVIDMPPASETIWWRGKLTILKTQYAAAASGGGDGQRCVASTESPGAHFLVQVGFFPSHCVQLFGNRFLRSFPGALQNGTILTSRPVLRRRGKWTTLLRLFLTNRPSRRALKEAGILKERIFGCDLAEHLESAGADVPVLLRTCADVIESNGVVDGIYRGSGVLSTVQRLRNAFDENRVPNLLLQDVHCVASLLKMYFRELPNPLLTYQLYDDFIASVEGEESTVKILRLHNVVQQLPPPHFRTAEYLMKHLLRVGEHCHKTGMHFPNLALVWAPNLLRTKELDNMEESTEALLRNVNTQAVVVEYLIRYADIIFSRKMPTFSTGSGDGAGDHPRRQPRPLSVACSISLPSSPSRLMTLEEAKTKLMACQNEKVPANVGLPDVSNRRCIDVNGGPSALPPLYHTVIQLPGSKSKVSKAASLGCSTAGSWKSLFGVWRTGQECEQQQHQRGALSAVLPPSSPTISNSHKQELVSSRPDSSSSNQEVKEINNRGTRKRLWHTRSAENVQTESTGNGPFISLDSSIRESSARRSFKLTKRGASKPKPSDLPLSSSPRANTLVDHHHHRLTPSPLYAPDASFVYSLLHSPATTSTTIATTNGHNNYQGLKPCRTTDIDRALRTVITVEAEPAIFTLRRREAAACEETFSIPAESCVVEATMIRQPTVEPVSEPSLGGMAGGDCVDGGGGSPITSRKAFSAPSSLQRPAAGRKEENAAYGEPKATPSHAARDQLEPPSAPEPPIPVSSITTREERFEPANCEKRQSLLRRVVGDNSTPRRTKRLSDSEEKLLLAQLRQTPPDSSPSHEELQRLLPELGKIYSSLEQLPTTVVSVLETEADEQQIEEEEEQEPKMDEIMAASISDLEVLEANPEWSIPSGENEQAHRDEEPRRNGHVDSGFVSSTKDEPKKPAMGNGMVEGHAAAAMEPVGKSGQLSIQIRPDERKSLKDAATSPVPEHLVKNTGCSRTEEANISSPSGANIHRFMITASSQSPDEFLSVSAGGNKGADHEDGEPGNAMKFISFKEANAVFDRHETLQAVQSSHCQDSEEESMILDSIYDNVISSREKREKPTPKPRASKLKSAADVCKTALSSNADEAKENKRLSSSSGGGNSHHIPKQHRPCVLPITGILEQKAATTSSEESELANSPLFRKQQQQLFSMSAVAPPRAVADRNKSEPPVTDSERHSSIRRERFDFESKGQSIAAKSESHLHHHNNRECYDEDEDDIKRREPAPHRIAPSPRSAFSPVLPKMTVPPVSSPDPEQRENETRLESKSNNQSSQQLHSILSTSKVQRAPTSKRKDAKVYFV